MLRTNCPQRLEGCDREPRRITHHNVLLRIVTLTHYILADEAMAMFGMPERTNIIQSLPVICQA